jgi:hypothetical protein
MILSRWQGFEIDSSEGYYVFEKEMDHTEEGWLFLRKLLLSPLLWPKVAFEVEPLEKYRKSLTEKQAGLLRRKVIERAEIQGPFSHVGHPRPYAASLPSFITFIEKARSEIASLSLNFCLAPLRSLRKGAYRKFREWYVARFNDARTGKKRWRKYLRVSSNDLRLRGNVSETDLWTDSFAFEARFDLRLRRPFQYSLFVPASDPSLFVYLLTTLAEYYWLVFKGDHYISVKAAPDSVPIARLPGKDDGEEEQIEPARFRYEVRYRIAAGKERAKIRLLSYSGIPQNIKADLRGPSEWMNYVKLCKGFGKWCTFDQLGDLFLETDYEKGENPVIYLFNENTHAVREVELNILKGWPSGLKEGKSVSRKRTKNITRTVEKASRSGALSIFI